MYNIFKVYPGDMCPSREYFIGTVKTIEEAKNYEKKWEEENPRTSSWDAYIDIREVEFMET